MSMMKQISAHDAEILRTEFYWSEERFKDCNCDKVCECKREYDKSIYMQRGYKFCPWCGGKIKETKDEKKDQD